MTTTHDRHVLEPDAHEAATARELFRLYIALGGAKAAARAFNQGGFATRSGVPWTKDLVLHILGQDAVTGTYWWGRHDGAHRRPREEWIPLAVAPIVDADVYALARQLRARRDPVRRPGRTVAAPHLLTGLVRCGRCGASYQLETSGKRVDGAVYRYCYYNCRSACRAGVEVCAGFRVATATLDAAVLGHVADAVCGDDRLATLERLLTTSETATLSGAPLRATWRAFVTTDARVARAYLLHLVDRIEVHGSQIVVVPRVAPITAEPATPGGRKLLA